MRQNQDFKPIEGLTQCQTCLDCPMFINFEGDRQRGWCSAFERISRTFHPRINSCELAIKEYQQQNPIEVAVTLCSHELAVDPDDGMTYPKEEKFISFVVPEFTRKAVTEAFEPYKDQFKGFYISSFNRCYPNAEF